MIRDNYVCWYSGWMIWTVMDYNVFIKTQRTFSTHQVAHVKVDMVEKTDFFFLLYFFQIHSLYRHHEFLDSTWFCTDFQVDLRGSTWITWSLSKPCCHLEWRYVKVAINEKTEIIFCRTFFNYIISVDVTNVYIRQVFAPCSYWLTIDNYICRFSDWLTWIMMY